VALWYHDFAQGQPMVDFPHFELPGRVMTFTVRHGFSMALIEIDGLPGFTEHKNGGSFHGYVTNNQRVHIDLVWHKNWLHL